MERPAAAGLAYLFGDSEASGLHLHVVTQTQTTVTLGWEPVPGAVGYRFSSSTSQKFSHTWDPERSTVRFSKAEWYKVEALFAEGEMYPPPTLGLVSSVDLQIGE